VPRGPRVSNESAAALAERLCESLEDCVRLDGLGGKDRPLLGDDLAPTPSAAAAIARAFAKALRPRRAP
jgi:hypothetical protein